MSVTDPSHEVHTRSRRAAVGTDGNAFVVLGAMTRALRDAGVSSDEIAAFTSEATAGDYDTLLETCLGWVEVC